MSKIKILSEYSAEQENNGGPVTALKLLINSSLKDEFQFIKMPVSFKNKSYLNVFTRIYKQIRQSKADIVHVRGIQLEGFFGVLAGKIAGHCKIVMSIHGMAVDMKNLHPVKKFLYTKILEPFAMRNADLVYCVCDYAKNRDYVKNNAKFIYNTINNAEPAYCLDDKSIIRKSLREQYSINENDVAVTIISRVTYDKGMKFLAECIKKYDLKPAVKFIIGGEGDYLAEINDLLKSQIQSGQVILPGKVSNVRDFLFASDIYVFPTLHENFSNSLLEACSAALPCVATNVGGNGEIIKNRQTGLLVEPMNSPALKEGLDILINDRLLREDYGKRAKEFVALNFSQEKVFSDMARMYNYVMTI